MQKFLSKYGTAAHLAILAVASLFLYPFCTTQTIARALLWLSIPAALWALFEPSRLKSQDEQLHEARRRVWRGILTDPVFWVFATMILFAFLRWLNDGIKLAYDAEQSKWIMQMQAIPFFPGCAPDAGFLPLAILVSVTVLFMGCRHSLGRKARVAFLVYSTSLASLAALIAVVAYHCGHARTVELTTCSLNSASYFGTAFGFYFLGGIVALIGIYDSHWNKWLLPVSVVVTMPIVGLYFFAPTPVILLYLLAAILLLVVSCAYARMRLTKAVPIKCCIMYFFVMALPVLIIMSVASPELHHQRYGYLFAEKFALFDKSFLTLRDVLSQISEKAWTIRPWSGSGLSTFALNIRFHALPEDWAILKIGQSVPLNGWWFLLVERGIIGALSYALVIGSIFVVYGIRLAHAIKRRFYWPMGVLGPLALLALCAETLIDVSFLRSDVSLVAGAYLALACSAFPRPRTDESNQS